MRAWWGARRDRLGCPWWRGRGGGPLWGPGCAPTQTGGGQAHRRRRRIGRRALTGLTSPRGRSEVQLAAARPAAPSRVMQRSGSPASAAGTGTGGPSRRCTCPEGLGGGRRTITASPPRFGSSSPPAGLQPRPPVGLSGVGRGSARGDERRRGQGASPVWNEPRSAGRRAARGQRQGCPSPRSPALIVIWNTRWPAKAPCKRPAQRWAGQGRLGRARAPCAGWWCTPQPIGSSQAAVCLDHPAAPRSRPAGRLPVLRAAQTCGPSRLATRKVRPGSARARSGRPPAPGAPPAPPCCAQQPGQPAQGQPEPRRAASCSPAAPSSPPPPPLPAGTQHTRRTGGAPA